VLGPSFDEKKFTRIDTDAKKQLAKTKQEQEQQTVANTQAQAPGKVAQSEQIARNASVLGTIPQATPTKQTAAQAQPPATPTPVPTTPIPVRQPAPISPVTAPASMPALANIPKAQIAPNTRTVPPVSPDSAINSRNVVRHGSNPQQTSPTKTAPVPVSVSLPQRILPNTTTNRSDLASSASLSSKRAISDTEMTSIQTDDKKPIISPTANKPLFTVHTNEPIKINTPSMHEQAVASAKEDEQREYIRERMVLARETRQTLRGLRADRAVQAKKEEKGTLEKTLEKTITHNKKEPPETDLPKVA
jgi:hypothetical protein